MPHRRLPAQDSPPYDLLEFPGGFAVLVEVGPAEQLAITPEVDSISVSGTRPSRSPLPYPNQRFIYNGRPAGPFRYEFAVPGLRHIRAADSIEADVHDGLLSVTVIHAKRN